MFYFNSTMTATKTTWQHLLTLLSKMVKMSWLEHGSLCQTNEILPHYLIYMYNHSSLNTLPLLILTGSGTSNNLHQLASNDRLSGSVIQDLELVNHLVGVLGRVVHGVATGGLLDGMSLGKCPEEVVGESVFPQVDQHFIINLELGKVGCSPLALASKRRRKRESTYETG